MSLPIANIFGPENWLLIVVVALLLFGRRLPKLWRSVGGTTVSEFLGPRIIIGLGIAALLLVYLLVRNN